MRSRKTSVSIFLRSADGASQSEAYTGDSGIVVTDATNGVIDLYPSLLSAALTFAKSQYLGYIIVVDGDGARTSFPSNGEFLFNILERYTGDS